MKYRIKEKKTPNPICTGEAQGMAYRDALEYLDAPMFLTSFDVQLKKYGFWVTIKSFQDNADPSYARRCAEELLDNLEENI